ncbi:MAG: cellulase family glycosylhydrolase [Oscillospiraceae bacterium]|nr:cellulase family glycosylhydrolase [Oscillospiraceae bacterium]
MKYIKRAVAYIFVFAILCTCLAITSQAKAEEVMPKIATEGQHFVDEHGRLRIFNGLNYVIDKQGPADQLDDKWFEHYAAKGFNVLRLGLYWVEIEPEPDAWNEAYLASIDPIFDAAANNGVYIMLELHQDLYGKAAGGFGKGAPDWACLNDGAKQREQAKFVWAEGYFWGKGVHKSFDNFWTNAKVDNKGLQDHYAELWAMMAARWGDSPAMLGYDFMNEPLAGSEFGKVFRSMAARIPVVGLRHPIKMIKMGLRAIRGETLHILDDLDGDIMRKITRAGDKRMRKFDEEKYTPFLAKMSNTLRETTFDGIVFMEHGYPNLGHPFHASVPKNETNMAYSPHGYDFVVDTPPYANPSDGRVLSIFEEARRAQQRLNVPVLVGEWGGAWGDKRLMKHLETLLERFDSYGWSHTFYPFPQGGWGWFEVEGLDFLARPYPMAINGRDASYQYDKAAGVFTLEFTQTENNGQPTIIYLPREGKMEAGDLTVEVIENGHERSMPGARYVYLTGEAGMHRVTVAF